MVEFPLYLAIATDISLVGNGIVATAVVAFLAWLRQRIKQGKLELVSATAKQLQAELADEKAARFAAESERDHLQKCKDHLEKEKDAAQERTITILSKLNKLENAVMNGNTPVPKEMGNV